jgi:hypothetical protein
MANTKISGFPQVKNNDVPLITGFAAVGTAIGPGGVDQVGVNVKITGSSLITSLEQQLDLSNFLKGTLAVNRGGTGATTFTANGILIGNTTSAISATAALADGELLIGSTGNAPSPTTLTAGTGVTVTNGNGSITIANNAPDQTVVLNAGTGITTSGTYPNFTITNDSPNQATPAANDGSPSTGQLQYNDGSNGFAAADTLVYSSKVLSIGKVGDSARSHLKIFGGDDGAGNDQDAYLTLYCSAGTHGVTIEGPDHTGGSNYTLKLPASLPSVTNQILESNASGTLSWIATPTDTDTSIYAANGALTGARTVTMGAYNLTFASTTAGQEVKFQKNVRIDGQSYTPLETISSVTSWTPDWDNGNVQTMELTGATTINNNSSNIEVGATYIIILKQDAEGTHTVSWGSQYKFPAGQAPTITTTANKADVITLIAYSSTVLMCTSVQDFATS